MKTPKISIIIPVYNVEKYLEECLESIITQTLSDIEILCINDGSIDNSPTILNKFAQKDNRVIIINKENGGYASAINTGIEIAKGDFLQIVESDDYCDSKMCEAMYSKISQTDADLITADFYFLNGNKTKICKFLRDEDAEIEEYSIQTHPYIISKQAYPWKSLYRTSFIKENNIRMLQDGNGAYEDQPWNATILSLANKMLYINKPFYYYRLDANGSSTNNGSIRMINYIKRKAQTKDILEQNGVFTQEIKEYYSDSAVGGCLFFFKRISFEFKEEYYNKMKNFLKDIADSTLTYKYFSKKNKKKLDNILTKDYKDFYKNEIIRQKFVKFFVKGNK